MTEIGLKLTMSSTRNNTQRICWQVEEHDISEHILPSEPATILMIFFCL